LLAIRADRVWVGKREYGGLLVALSPTAVSDGGGYAALFGE
jgi:stage II sporulation protein GA (sporulation sigma-E factor processing peptidase)